MFDEIIDALIRATAEQYSVRIVTNPVEAKKLNVKVGDHILERCRCQIMH